MELLAGLGIDTDGLRPGCGNGKVTEPHVGERHIAPNMSHFVF